MNIIYWFLISTITMEDAHGKIYNIIMAMLILSSYFYNFLEDVRDQIK